MDYMVNGVLIEGETPKEKEEKDRMKAYRGNMGRIAKAGKEEETDVND